MTTSEFNRRWARVILEALTRHGVSQVCIAPGSRSTPLTLEAAANPKLTCHTHFDERGLGHLALGLAKGTAQPVAIIVTSGTAVANLYPAVIEAGLTGERLIVLTADRPPELIDCGANQAIRQSGIFASHPVQSLDLPRPDPALSATWLVSVIDELVAKSPFGGIHINCPFAEPLYGSDKGVFADWSQQLGSWWQDNQPWLFYSQPTAVAVQQEWPQWRKKRGVVIAGKMSATDGRKVAVWCECLGWPLISDVLSQTGQPLPHADIWLQHPLIQSLLQQAEFVIQFGTHLTGKRLLQWQAASKPEQYWLIAPAPGRQDPAHHQGHRIVADVSEWLSVHPPLPFPPWAESLPALVAQVKQQVIEKANQQFGEAQLAACLPALLPENGQLFIGNSLVIRLIDALAQLPYGYPIYSNRGASGIDGLLATAAGVARASLLPTLVILGDQSTLYDLNSLMLLRNTAAPLVIIVVNNNGGAIFSLLPTPVAERERFYQLPHNLDFSHAAALFGLDYCCPENWQQLTEAIQQVWCEGGTLLLELQVEHEGGVTVLQQLLQQVREQ